MTDNEFENKERTILELATKEMPENDAKIILPDFNFMEMKLTRR